MRTTKVHYENKPLLDELFNEGPDPSGILGVLDHGAGNSIPPEGRKIGCSEGSSMLIDDPLQ